MPNHITNILDVTGPEADVEAFRKKVSSENPELVAHLRAQYENIIQTKEKEVIEGERSFAQMELDNARASLKSLEENPIVLDFEGTVPMPVEIRNTVSGSLTPEQEKRQAALKKKYGHADWYNWSIANWGTKWGAYSIGEVEDIDYGIRYRFDTAWAPPVEWLVTTSAQFPRLTFTDCWKDEGGGAGRLDVQEGDYTETEMSDHDWMMEHDEGYAEEYEFLVNGDYEKVRDEYLERNECDRYVFEEKLLERLRNEDLPLFINFAWYNCSDEFEERCKSCHVNVPQEVEYVAPPRKIRTNYGSEG